jgi:hypothetical protein
MKKAGPFGPALSVHDADYFVLKYAVMKLPSRAVIVTL